MELQTEAAKAAQLGGTENKLHYALAMAGCKVTLIDGPEMDAILAGLRLLAREVKAGTVKFAEDDLIGHIWTNAGDHDGLPYDEIQALGDRLQGK